MLRVQVCGHLDGGGRRAEHGAQLLHDLLARILHDAHFVFVVHAASQMDTSASLHGEGHLKMKMMLSLLQECFD